MPRTAALDMVASFASRVAFPASLRPRAGAKSTAIAVTCSVRDTISQWCRSHLTPVGLGAGGQADPDVPSAATDRPQSGQAALPPPYSGDHTAARCPDWRSTHGSHPPRPLGPGRCLAPALDRPRRDPDRGGRLFLVGLAAQIAIPLPFTPVPLTAQTFAVLLAGAALGSIRGILSMLLYTVVGLVGVPWFAEGSSGFSMPSFGYILGFIAGAGLVGWLAEAGWTRTPWTPPWPWCWGNVVIYAIGVPWLKVAMGATWAGAVQMGMTPFPHRRRHQDRPGRWAVPAAVASR